MKQAIGYLFTAALALTAVFFIAILGYKGLLLPVWQLSTHRIEAATIVECSGKHFKNKTQYAPVAAANNGEKVVGVVFYSKSSCEESVGETVKVLLPPQPGTGGAILTFTQFWLFPLGIFTLVSFVIAGLVSRRKKKINNA